jgi:hypothetical protein
MTQNLNRCEGCQAWTWGFERWCGDCFEKANWSEFEKLLESPNPVFVRKNLKRFRIGGKERARRNG